MENATALTLKRYENWVCPSGWLEDMGPPKSCVRLWRSAPQEFREEPHSHTVRSQD